MMSHNERNYLFFQVLSRIETLMRPSEERTAGIADLIVFAGVGRH